MDELARGARGRSVGAASFRRREVSSGVRVAAAGLALFTSFCSRSFDVTGQPSAGASGASAGHGGDPAGPNGCEDEACAGQRRLACEVTADGPRCGSTCREGFLGDPEHGCTPSVTLSAFGESACALPESGGVRCLGASARASDVQSERTRAVTTAERRRDMTRGGVDTGSVGRRRAPPAARKRAVGTKKCSQGEYIA